MSAITQAVESPHNLQLLTTILIAKLMATLFAIGLGIPWWHYWSSDWAWGYHGHLNVFLCPVY